VRAIASVPGTFRRPALLDCSDSILLEVRGEPSALDHEAADHAVELRAVVVLCFDVVEEVRDGLRRGVGIELDADLACGRVEFDLGIRCERGQGNAHRDSGDGDQERTAQHRVYS